MVKDALADISVFGYLAARFVLGALPMIWIYREDLRKLTRDEAWAGVQVGLFMFGGYAFQTAGIARTTPSKAAFITGLSVVLVPVFLAAFWRKKIGAWAWGGAAASFAGLYFLTVPMQGFAELNRGDLLVMGCAVLYALQIIFIARYTGKYSLGALSCLQVILAGVLSTIAVPILNATRLGTFLCPLHISDGVRRDRHGDFHNRSGLSASRVGTKAYHRDEYGADSHGPNQYSPRSRPSSCCMSGSGEGRSPERLLSWAEFASPNGRGRFLPPGRNSKGRFLRAGL